MDTMAQAAAGTLRERAKAALMERQKETEEQERREERQALKQRVDALVAALAVAGGWLGDLAPTGDINEPTVVIDGVHFEGVRYYRSGSYGYGLVTVNNCPKCGQRTTGEFLNSLADLGELLVNFTPNQGHRCPQTAAEAPKPTLAEELVDAFRRIVREELDARDGD